MPDGERRAPTIRELPAQSCTTALPAQSCTTAPLLRANEPTILGTKRAEFPRRIPSVRAHDEAQIRPVAKFVLVERSAPTRTMLRERLADRLGGPFEPPSFLGREVPFDDFGDAARVEDDRDAQRDLREAVLAP